MTWVILALLKKKRKRGSYSCSKCGKPKKGHSCIQKMNEYQIENPSQKSSSTIDLESLIQELQDLKDENFFLKNEIDYLKLKMRKLYENRFNIPLTYNKVNFPHVFDSSLDLSNCNTLIFNDLKKDMNCAIIINNFLWMKWYHDSITCILKIYIY